MSQILGVYPDLWAMNAQGKSALLIYYQANPGATPQSARFTPPFGFPTSVAITNPTSLGGDQWTFLVEYGISSGTCGTGNLGITVTDTGGASPGTSPSYPIMVSYGPP